MSPWLTGESDSVFKTVGDKLMSGSNVVSGTCLVTATAVGPDSYINKLAKSSKEFKKYPSQLRDYMDKIFKNRLHLAGASCHSALCQRF